MCDQPMDGRTYTPSYRDARTHLKIEIETLLYIEFEMSTEIIDGLSLILHLFLLFAEAKQTVLSEHSREWYI